MNDVLKTIFGLAGGLAIFLYGMNAMSDALQKTAGEKMKQILGFLTRNPVLGAVAGALVTAVLQSSSATTVMVIGFVSAGLMTLPQAISVIFGANIGTTMTAQLLAFKISHYIYPIIFVGFIINFVCKKEKVKNIGMVIFAFGLLFEGIEIMGSVMKPLASASIFITLMEKVSSVPVLGVVLGAVMTLLVQSSSATIAVLQNFASQPAADGVSSVMGLSGAIPILFGDNIGTTITALLASIGQSKNAKRTAVAHSVFNITGSILFLCLLRPFTAFVVWITSFVATGTPVQVISRQIANAHTSFNIVVTLIWLPLLPLMVKIVNLIVRGEDKGQKVFSPRYLNNGVLGQPVAAIFLAAKEIARCSQDARLMLQATKGKIGSEAALAPQAGDEQSPQVYRMQQIDFETQRDVVLYIQEAVTAYIKKLFSGGHLTEQQSEQAAGLLYVTNNLERIANRCEELNQTLQELGESGKVIPDAAKEELANCFSILQRMFDSAMQAVEAGSEAAAKSVTDDYVKLRKSVKKFRKAHAKRVESGQSDASLTADFAGILYTLNRIADNCISVAEEALDDVSFRSLEMPDESVLSKLSLAAEVGSFGGGING